MERDGIEARQEPTGQIGNRHLVDERADQFCEARDGCLARDAGFHRRPRVLPDVVSARASVALRSRWQAWIVLAAGAAPRARRAAVSVADVGQAARRIVRAAAAAAARTEAAVGGLRKTAANRDDVPARVVDGHSSKCTGPPVGQRPQSPFVQAPPADRPARTRRSCSGSFWRSTQAPLHTVSCPAPSGHTRCRRASQGTTPSGTARSDTARPRTPCGRKGRNCWGRVSNRRIRRCTGEARVCTAAFESLHVRSPSHCWPQLPQFASSDFVSTHTPLQSVFPLDRRSRSSGQVLPPVHATPQAPQLLLPDRSVQYESPQHVDAPTASQQALPHAVSPAAQHRPASLQVPPWHGLSPVTPAALCHAGAPTGRRTAAPMRPADRRAQVAVRAALVSSRTRVHFLGAGVGAARGMPHRQRERGHLRHARAGAGTARARAGSPRAVADGDRGVTEQLTAIDQALAQAVRADVVAQRFCTAPGIGPVTALTFEAVVDNVARFDSARRCAPTWASCRASRARGAAPARPHHQGGECATADAARRGRLEHPALRARGDAAAARLGPAHRRAPRQTHRRRGARAQARGDLVRDVAGRQRLRTARAAAPAVAA